MDRKQEQMKLTEQELNAIELLVDQFRQRLIENHKDLINYATAINSSEEKFKTYVKVIADYFCIEPEKITGKRSRLTEIKRARHILWWLCRTGESNVKWSLSKIGQKTCLERAFDHATVLHGVRTIGNDIDYDPATKQDLKAIVECLGFRLVKNGANYKTVI